MISGPGCRPPAHPRLRAWIKQIWILPGRHPGESERLIPSGSAHLVWRLGEEIRLPGQPVGRFGLLGGPRSVAHSRIGSAAWTVGVELLPAALPVFFHVPACELAERHVPLELLWGAPAVILQSSLEAQPSFSTVEASLLAQLIHDPAPPGFTAALGLLSQGGTVSGAAALVGRSPRCLHQWFIARVGLSPSRWAAVQRVGRVLRLATRGVQLGEPLPRAEFGGAGLGGAGLGGAGLGGADLALAAGFADHSHLCRDFRAVSGMTLGEWQRGYRPTSPAHVRFPIGSSGMEGRR